MSEEYKNILERVYETVEECLKEYRRKREHSDYEKGLAEGIYEMADSIRNQAIIDEVEIDKKINTIIDELEKAIM